MNEYTIDEPASGPICDFCSDPRIFASYPAKDFTAGQFKNPDGKKLVANSRGGWAACKTCTELIEAGKWESLLDRSIATFLTKYGTHIPAQALRGFIADLHKQFRENRQPIH
jgi:hypothetical protein